MTRREALRQLEGTRRFDLQNGRVRIREHRLLAAVAAQRHDEAGGGSFATTRSGAQPRTDEAGSSAPPSAL